MVPKEKPAPTNEEISAEIAVKAKAENPSASEILEEREAPEDLKVAK